jgi:hypothetical protein
MSYLGAAVSLSEGHGLRIPTAPWGDGDSTTQLKAFPPGYSLALAVPIRMGASPLAAARAVQAAAAGVTATIVASLALSLAGPWAAALVTGLLLLTPALVEDHLSVMSEPLYLMLLAVFLAMMLRRPGHPFLLGTVAALGIAVRYLGGALAGAAVLWALFRGGTRRERLRRAALALLPTLLLGLVWVFTVHGTAGRPPATALTADFHLAGGLQELRDALVLWLGPGPEEAGWVVPLALMSGLLGTWLFYRALRHIEWERGTAEGLPALWLGAGVIALCHLGVLLFSRIFVGHEIPFDSRLLSPLIVVVELLFAVTVAGFWPTWRWHSRTAVLLILLCWAGGALGWGREWIEDAHTNGWDFNSDDWRRSPTVAWVREAGGYALFSNHPVPLWFHAGRPSRDLPQSLDPDTVAAFARALRDRHGAVIVFADTSWEPGVPVDSLAARVPLKLVAKFEDGAIYEGPLAISR